MENKELFNEELSQALAEAIKIACRIHDNQMYGEHHYLYHVQQVAESVTKAFGLGIRTVIAWLHDTWEDTDDRDALEEELRSKFATEIVESVLALSRRDGESLDSYVKRVKADQLALDVKLHDSLCNLTKSVGDRDVKRIAKYTTRLYVLTHEL